MAKRFLTVLAVGLMAAGSAHAQYGGGQGGGGMPGGGHGGGGRGGGHRGQGQRPDPPPSAPSGDAVRPGRETSPDKVDIVGVIQAIDTQAGRVTIAYEPVDALNWPAGTMPFVVEKPELLQGAAVGEKVSFRIESQQIYEMRPFTPRQPGS